MSTDIRMSEFPASGPINFATDYVPIVRLVAGVPENVLALVADLDVSSGGASGGGGGAVASVFGRTGNVVAVAGDYNWNQIAGAVLPAVSGANLTNLNASQLTAGTVPVARLPVIPPANGGTGTTVVFTQGSVVFAGPGGAFAQDNANFLWDDASNVLAVKRENIALGSNSTGLADLLINPITKTSGYLIDAQVNSVSKFRVNQDGYLDTIAIRILGGNSSGADDFLINPTAKTSGYLIDAQVNSVSKFRVNSQGYLDTIAIRLLAADSSGADDFLINPTAKTSGYLIKAQVNGATRFSVDVVGSLRFYDNVGIERSGAGVLKVTDVADANARGWLFARRADFSNDPAYSPGAGNPANYFQNVRSVQLVTGNPNAADKWQNFVAWTNITGLTAHHSSTQDFYGFDSQIGVVDAANTFNLWTIYGVHGNAFVKGAGNIDDGLIGVMGKANAYGSGTVAKHRGVQGWPASFVGATGTSATVQGVYGIISNDASGYTMTTAVAGDFLLNSNYGTIGNAYVVRARAETIGTGTVTGNRYGVYIADQAIGTVVGSVYNFYSAGAARMNVIEGSLSVGSFAIPTLTTGSVLFAGPTGAIAQNNANFFWDDTSGSERLGLGTATPGVLAGLSTTIGRVLHLFATTNRATFQITSSNLAGIVLETVNATTTVGRRAFSFVHIGNLNLVKCFYWNEATGATTVDNVLVMKNDGTVGIGGVPTQKLEVVGNIFVNTSTANLLLFNTATGWQSSANWIINPLPNNSVRTPVFASGVSGWSINAAGDAEFNNLTSRGEIRASVFNVNEISATAGTLGVFYSASNLTANATTPASAGTSFDLVAKNSDAGGMLFGVGDVLRVKTLTATGIGDSWFTINTRTNNGANSTYNVTLRSGSTNITFPAGTAVIDYGPINTAFITLSTDGTVGTSANLSMATHAGSPWSALTLRLRIGNLNGSYDYVTDRYGFATGQRVTNQSWVTIDDDPGPTTGGLRMGAGTTTRIQIAPDGSGFLANGSISWTNTGFLTVGVGAKIANWTINATSLSNGEVKIAAGENYNDVGATAEAWFGKSVTGQYGMLLKGPSGGRLYIMAGDPAVGSSGRPYLALYDGAGTPKYRIVIGELNSTRWNSDGSAGLGMKIWQSATQGGARLVEFSDVRNEISGWAINAGSISKGVIKIATNDDFVNAAATAEGWFGNHSTGIVGLFLKGTTPAYMQVIANHSGIGSSRRPVVLIADDAGRIRIALGELNFYNGIDSPNASMGLKIWNDAGAQIVRFAEASGGGNMISGWTIDTTKISSNGVVLNSGAGAGLGFGTTPPTSANPTGQTGVWLDQTGLYGLGNNAVQAKVDATNGSIVAGAGTVTLDTRGIRISEGTALEGNYLSWLSGTTRIFEFWGFRAASPNSSNGQIVARALSTDTLGYGQLWFEGQNAAGAGSFIKVVHHSASHATNPNKGLIVLQSTLGMVLITQGTGSPVVASVALKVTDGAILAPTFTTTARDALTALDAMIIYNTTTNKLQVRAAGAWVDLH